MKTIITTLLKGFRVAKLKLVLCLLAAVLSSWGISTIIYSYLMTERDFEVNFVATNPADIVLSIDFPSIELIAKIKQHPKIKEVERREALSGRIRNRSGNWMYIQLFGAENISTPLVSKFELNGEVGTSGLLVENNGRNFLADPADSLTVQFAGGDAFKLKFSGTVYDPGQAPSQMEQAVYGYIAIDEIAFLLNDRPQRFLVKCNSKYNRTELHAIAEEVNAMADEKFSLSYVIPPPGEHPHQGIVNGIAFLQKSFGYAVALLGAILLSLILTTWLYPQISQIGVMKATGASAGMILGGYCIVLLLILLIGSAAGMQLGYRTAVLYDRSVAFIQNFRQITDPLPAWTHLFTLLAVILVPLLFVIFPLIKFSQTSVHDALNHVFQNKFSRLFEITQASLNRVPVKYSLNNLFRSPQRIFLLWILMTTGIALYTTGVNLKHSLKSDFATYTDDPGYGITVVLKDSSEARFSFLDSIPAVDKYSYVMTRNVRYQTADTPTEEISPIRFFEPGYEVAESRLLEGELKPDCFNCLYINQRMQKNFENVPLNSPIKLSFQNNRSLEFIYSGVVKDITHPGFFTFTKNPNTAYYEIAIKIREDVSGSDATRILDDAFLEHDIDVRQIADASTMLAGLENHLAPMYLIVQVMGFATMAIGLIGLLIVLSLAIEERARETGILKAIGATNGSIITIFQVEFVVVTLIAIISGSIVGYYFNAKICSLFGAMVINVPVRPINDFTALAVAATGVIFVQVVVIFIYVRVKLRRSSVRLLGEMI